MLPNCDFRGQETVDRKNRQRWECVHPKMTGGQPLVLVSEGTCTECQYAQFDVPTLTAGYQPKKPTRVSPEVFLSRCQTCEPCEHRAGNYCKRSGGCGLAKNLQIKEFGCPEGKFERI